MLQFNLEQISAFVAVAKAGSFNQAAKQQEKSRSTLHQHVTNLEVDLNLTLFHREGKRLYLTVAGQSLLKRANHFIYQAEALQNCADSLASSDTNELTVIHDAVLPTSIMSVADQWVKDAYPMVNIHWLHRSRSEMYRQLKKGEADIGLALSAKNSLPMQGVEFFNLGSLKMQVYASKQSTLAQRQPCSVHDLSSHTRLLLEDYIDTPIFRRSELGGQDKLLSNADMLISLLVQDGWAFLPTLLAKQYDIDNKLTPLSLEVTESPHFEEYILYSNRIDTAGPALSLLISSLKQLFETYLTPLDTGFDSTR
ncbi:LysR family transcriptional regulator [Vibrio sp. WXL210]|uniref:LysR family transcriptional regulator n=1 Tax=Vibrio sp. WXL210 TaxID=3450709 RepID=UPI003EC7A6F6